MTISQTSSHKSLAERLRSGLIVSCQALPGEALFGGEIMAKLAVAAERGGAVGIRANSPVDIAAIRAVTTLPIIGLYKVDVADYDVYITPTLRDAQAVADAGADMIALDATDRPHPEGTTAEFIAAVRAATGLPVLADISTFDEGVAAQAAGAEFVSTTMSGYTPYSPQLEGPDLELVTRLASALDVPLFAEGRIHTPEQARAALDAGAFAVIVGGAITRPQQITERFARAVAGK
ncbi:MAG: N-acetylmannosamine-6-phosphate 2-epimerase [Capsulimonas sp.]|uniref:N-acetylmannosamine-6-phosphate 2-epimerase n=1 Tax=Capsulimonas sp. TaxID=2494211 RepID=UPI0032630763